MKGIPWAQYLVMAGALCGMTTTVTGFMFALPRCVYAMANDGLLFRWLARVNKRTKVPLNAIIVFSLLTGLCAMVFDVSTLVEFLSIGTLLTYTIVAVCVIRLRYQPHELKDGSERLDQGLQSSRRERLSGGSVRPWLPCGVQVSKMPGRIIWALLAMTLGFCFFALASSTGLFFTVWGYLLLTLGAVLSVGSIVFIAAHHQTSATVAYKVPFVPLLPAISVLLNVLMMIHLSLVTWLRLAVWLAIGEFCRRE